MLGRIMYSFDAGLVKLYSIGDKYRVQQKMLDVVYNIGLYRMKLYLLNRNGITNDAVIDILE